MKIVPPTPSSDDAARDRIRRKLDPPARELLAAYFDEAGPFAATTFDTFGENPADRVTAEDLFAVSMLDIRIEPRTMRQMLGPRAKEVTALLEPLPTDVDLWDATPEVLLAIRTADFGLRGRSTGFDGVGPVVASKILARKRPRLVPVIDSVVIDQLGQEPTSCTATREALARWLCAPDLQHTLLDLASPYPGVSSLRALDVVLWMLGSAAGTAQDVRGRLGLHR